jgi:hypothetical protein
MYIQLYFFFKVGQLWIWREHIKNIKLEIAGVV